MMVHRVGNTLLLDEFDVHRHLLRQEQEEWKWLRKFYYETIVQSMQSRVRFVFGDILMSLKVIVDFVCVKYEF